MDFPQNLKYSKDHTWLKVENENSIIGITDFAQNELGEMVYVDLPKIGQHFKQCEIFGSFEAVKTTSDLFMPVSGHVTEINPQLNSRPTLVNSSPFSEGWLIGVKMDDISQ